MNDYPRTNWANKGTRSSVVTVGTSLQLLLPRDADRIAFTVAYSGLIAGSVLFGPTGIVSPTDGMAIPSTPVSINYHDWDAAVGLEWSAIASAIPTAIVLIETYWVHPPEREGRIEAKLPSRQRADNLSSTGAVQPKPAQPDCVQLLREFGVPVVGRRRYREWRNRTASGVSPTRFQSRRS